MEAVWDKIKGFVTGVGSAISSFLTGGSGTPLTDPGSYGNIDFSNLGKLNNAAGGLFTQPTLGVIGEAGPELLLPLNNPSRSNSLMQQAGIGGGDTYNFSMTVNSQAQTSTVIHDFTMMRTLAVRST
jgi:phage-related minor tail protein